MSHKQRGIGRMSRSLTRAFVLAWDAAPGLAVASAVLVVVQSVMPLVALYLVKLIVDAIAAAMARGLSADPTALQAIFVLIAAAAAVALIAALANSVAGVLGEAQSQRVADHVQDVMHAKSIEVDLAYYENSEYYDTLHRAQQEAPYRPGRIAKGLIVICQSALSLAAMAALLFSLHWGVALVLLLAVVPEGLVHLRYASTQYDWRRRNTPTERRARYFSDLLTANFFAQELRLFGLGNLFVRQYRDLRERLRREGLALLRRRALHEWVAQSLATVAVFGAYAYIAWTAVGGGITLGDLVMYFQGFQRGQDFLRQLLRGLSSLYEDSLFLTNLYEFLDLKRKVREPERPHAMPRPLRDGIVFEKVSFGYGGKQVLRDVDLVIPAGATIALVGENGSGKTTLIKLLARLYDPDGGRILFDGIDARDFSTTTLRRQLSVIFQDYARYNLTVRENIWFGDIERAADPPQLARAARQAGAADLIDRLPGGMDTVLGNYFDTGEELSVGEWQKIALARALLRDAQVIVLDEPTSAMDASAEYEMFRRFRELAAGRSAILVSHRLSTVKMADRIYVLREGRVIESGTHDELVRRAGRYADLFEAQASGYR
ncbi:MAG TPA: ABC transporter ATP-binding protein [Burkholderiaceae bacterium]|nr:ABC transporter ATP-binding protein [Burkholderiaceae bacterium]